MALKKTKIKDKVNREFVDLLYNDFHFLLIGESLGAILYVVMLWGSIDNTILATWLVLILLVNGCVRHIMTYAYRRNKRAGLIDNVNDWRKWFIMTVFMSGILWALGGSFFILVSNDLYRLLIIVIMVGIIGAANAVFIPDKYSYLAFVSPIYIILFAVLYTQHSSIYLILSLGILIQFLLSFRLAFNASRSIVKSLAFQFKNTELLQKIILAKNKVETISADLGNENAAILRVEKALQDLASHDQLTKLPNRHLLTLRLRQALDRAQRHNTYAALIFLDLDDFKNINDKMGHVIGDKLLVDCSVRMKKALRETDTVARFGGDEFCIVLDNIKTIDEINQIANQLLNNLGEPYHLENYNFKITASIGIAIFPDNSQDMEMLFKLADRALYQAKMQGKNTYQFYKE